MKERRQQPQSINQSRRKDPNYVANVRRELRIRGPESVRTVNHSSRQQVLPKLAERLRFTSR